ncbi:MAG: hypothetical protein R3B96_06730 [Pirellulaceae bacterium]
MVPVPQSDRFQMGASAELAASESRNRDDVQQQVIQRERVAR